MTAERQSFLQMCDRFPMSSLGEEEARGAG